jgi:hypothetical protein
MGNTTTFSAVIDNYKRLNKETHLLPFIHTTTEAGLFGFLHDFALKKNFCSVYNEEVLYFFYGKASYNIYNNLNKITKSTPITLVYDFSKLENFSIKRILPFDSGGYDRYKIQDYNKENFTYFNASRDTILKLIAFFYGSNSDYLACNVELKHLNNCKNDFWPFYELVKFYETLKNNPDLLEVGHQAYSIEFQLDRSIENIIPEKIFISYSFVLDNKIELLNKLKVKNPSLEFDFYDMDKILTLNGRPFEARDKSSLMEDKVNSYVISKMN